MRRTVVVVEEFYEDPWAVRDYALAQAYYRPYEPDAEIAAGRVRVSWLTSRFKSALECPFKSSDRLIDSLQSITGERIDMDHWRGTFPITNEGKANSDRAKDATTCLWNCSFHLKTAASGEGVHNHVTDQWNSVGPNGWAGLIYLNPAAPLSAGLKLWRNRDPKRTYDWMTSRDNWELVDVLGNVFNRILLCRGNLPHSGARGWDDRLERGRLYQTFFFKTHGPAPLPSLSLRIRRHATGKGGAVQRKL